MVPADVAAADTVPADQYAADDGAELLPFRCRVLGEAGVRDPVMTLQERTTDGPKL